MFFVILNIVKNLISKYMSKISRRATVASLEMTRLPKQCNKQ